ncbi:PQQ-binding-like beta-propeller repeat protein [Mesoaciditoga lauensis]|uniref:outer membrane protein assembly factor BamB family protein n=1 Tax=Mesoaciditoga lauensis TaxID=1495039 RepID=UPI000690168D|nr:PQQ-binding-like beta-propeller repeat protein [Mesoaciditoga lauensis]
MKGLLLLFLLAAFLSYLSHPQSFPISPSPTYTVSGYVKDAEGNPIPNIRIQSEWNGETQTDSDGHWTLELEQDVSNLIYPSESGWQFTPSEITVNSTESDVDFIGTYTVSGYVKDASNKPVSGATVFFSGGYSSVTTDSKGYWSKSGLAGNVTIMPSKSGWKFSSLNVNGPKDNIKFTGTYTVSGYVKDASNKPVSGATVFFSGGYSSVTTDSKGYWSKSGLAGNVIIMPSKNGEQFTPSCTMVTASMLNVDFTKKSLPYGGLRWIYQTGGGIYSSPAIGSDGTIYVGSEDKYLYAINPDGTLKWKYGTWGRIYSSPAIGSDGTIYVGSEDKYLYAINPDGTLKWKYLTVGKINSSPAIGSDGTIYVGSGRYLYALRLNGSLYWKYKSEDYIGSDPTIDADGTIYVWGAGSEENGGYLYAINSDGILKWKSNNEEGQAMSNPVIGPNGEIYIGVDYHCDWGCEIPFVHTFYAVDTDGTLLWKYDLGQGDTRGSYSDPAIGTNGTIYIGSGYYLYALRPNGTLYWKYKTQDRVDSRPAIGEDGTIYVGSDDGYLYAINPNGTLRWKYRTYSAVYSSPVIGSDGTIYVGTSNGYLYAIRSNSHGLGNTPWPMFRCNVRHSGSK